MDNSPDPSEDRVSPIHIPILFPTVGKTRNGKVARLPRETRDRINEMMLDGLVYGDIVAAMREEAPGLNEDNLSNWKSGGYTEWLRSKERREDLLAVQEAIMERALKTGASDLNKAALQMAVTKVFQLLDNLPPDSVKNTMDSNNFTRLLNVLVKLADGELRCERHLLETAERKQKDDAVSQGGLSLQGRKEIEDHRFTPPPA